MSLGGAGSSGASSVIDAKAYQLTVGEREKLGQVSFQRVHTVAFQRQRDCDLPLPWLQGDGPRGYPTLPVKILTIELEAQLETDLRRPLGLLNTDDSRRRRRFEHVAMPGSYNFHPGEICGPRGLGWCRRPGKVATEQRHAAKRKRRSHQHQPVFPHSDPSTQLVCDNGDPGNRGAVSPRPTARSGLEG